jgi:hypothetical protein
MFAVCLLLFLLCCGSRHTTVFCLARCSIDRKKKIKLLAKYGVEPYVDYICNVHHVWHVVGQPCESGRTMLSMTQSCASTKLSHRAESSLLYCPLTYSNL